MDVKKFRIRDDERFALDLLHREHILLTHGGGFHWEKPDHFRIVYLPEVKVLKEAAAAFSRFFDGYRQADPLADYGVDE